MSTAVFNYIAYGLVIASDIELPELIQVPDHESAPIDSRRHVTVRLGRVDRSAIDKPVGGPLLWARRGDACLFYEETGALRIINGREIVVDLIEGADPRPVRLFLLGPALALLLHQRGLLVVHA